MTEAILKSQLMKVLRPALPGFVCIRHEDRITSGIPDISITGNKRTTWVEVKFADPKFASKGIQELTALRLALAGHCVYVVYYADKFEQVTYIIKPCDIGKERQTWFHKAPGFNHQFVIDYIKEEHK